MSDMIYNVAAVILAAGVGSRMNMNVTKQRILINGESVLRHTLKAFDKSDIVTSLIVVCRADEIEFASAETAGLSKPVKIVIGGKNRAESAKNGFNVVSTDTEYVLIHDAARCLVTAEDIKKTAEAAFVYGAATASNSVSDTLKRVDESGFIEATVSRQSLHSVQTPQAFSVKLYRKALENADLDETVTDDNMLMEKIGVKPFCVETSRQNIKITESDDIALAEYIIRRRKEKI